MQDVVRGSERAAALTAQLLAYAGKGRLFVERLDLARLIREIAELMRSLIPRNVEVVLEFEEPLGTVLADAGQLQQVIMNLVINAGEAIGERPGTVWVSARGADVDAVELRERFGMFDIPPGRYVRLEVRDDGSGMTEETRAQVFEPFFTTKFLGRGLGLAATLGVVRSHHGGIDVQSVPGRGTTVTVILPQAELALADAPAPPARRAANRAPGGTVLVADDEELVRRAARNALAREGYTVLEAATGLEAVDVFRRHADGIAVVLLDMTMPHMSGDEAAQHILRQRPDVPIVATSGYGEMEALRRFTGSRVAAFLQKPYNDAQLVELVASVLARTGLPGGGGPV
jgi:CheY-like chemotaxis protein